MKTYEDLRKINVNEHVEKKNNLTYLSWVRAVDTMLLADPDAMWEYGDPKEWNGTYMVFCTVTMFGKKRTAQLPVMDYKNKAIQLPDAFQVNTAMQRCLAKAISLHGIGLYIYAGEDVPPDAADVVVQEIINADAKPNSGAWEGITTDMVTYLHDLAGEVQILISRKDVAGACDHIDAAILDNDHKHALWTLFDSKERSAMKKEWDSRKVVA